MCGISAIVSAVPDPRHAHSLRAMHAPIRHRGPDDERAVIAGANGDARRIAIAELDELPAIRCGMAFRRLKIVDVSEASAQPMASRDGRIWIVFNGEIYNFRELASQLVSRGHGFTSHGDTEVLLAAYEEWGTECFARLEGMWAIVILDLRRQRVIASRDRFGIKPLYFAIDGGRLLFASEIKQILPVLSARPRIDPEMVRMHLAGMRYPVTTESFWLDVRHVPPATWFEADLAKPDDEPRFINYWSLDDFTAQRERSYADSREELRATFAAAVEAHSVADVGLGSLLSGGLDSALVTSFLINARGSNFPTYSFGFRGAAPEACELPFVDEIVTSKQLPNFETTFDAPWIAANAERAVHAIEEPPMSPAVFAQFRTFELVAQHGTTVVLDGQGADEIFAGYPYHERDLLIDRLSRGQLHDFTRHLSGIGARQHRSMGYLIAYGLVVPWLSQYKKRYPWIEGGSRPYFDPTSYDGAGDPSRVNRRLHFDIKWGNVRIVLGFGDKNSMAHSIECRVPFFDRRVIELAFSMPDDFKVGFGDRKRVLRDIARESLPRSLTERADRMGFNVPTERFLRAGLREWALALINDDAFSKSPCFDRNAMLRYAGDFFDGRHHDAFGVWRLAALAVWRNVFNAELT